jgi:phosphatidylethanolamine N-methyltransferase
MSSSSTASGKEHLRERMPRPDVPSNPTSTDNAQNTVKSLNKEEADKIDNKKRTYGRTPEGKGMPCRCENAKHSMADTIVP